VYIPKKFADVHKMMENPYVQIINKSDGILIKPLEPAN
jgi:bifunctional DNA-binding transcriptional regulator/antitoxin component of YhaV-PrlF toxin-antitoxin module